MGRAEGKRSYLAGKRNNKKVNVAGVAGQAWSHGNGGWRGERLDSIVSILTFNE